MYALGQVSNLRRAKEDKGRSAPLGGRQAALQRGDGLRQSTQAVNSRGEKEASFEANKMPSFADCGIVDAVTANCQFWLRRVASPLSVTTAGPAVYFPGGRHLPPCFRKVGGESAGSAVSLFYSETRSL